MTSGAVFCSTVIATVGRDSLSRAVESVLAQDIVGAGFEVIVVNDSGQPLPPASWQESPRVRVIDTQRRERSVARNTGAAAARGQYLHFLDDDDWLASGAFQHLHALSQTSKAAWLYGMTQLVDRQGQPLIRLEHGLNGNAFMQVMAGEWIPLQSSLIERSAFRKVGGFNPLISGPEDIDLLRRVLLFAEIAETPHLIASVVRGEEGSTTDYGQHAQASRWAREAILDMPGVLGRMRQSAGNPFWSGRMLRVFLTSAVWNLRRGRGFTTASRLSHAVAAFAYAGRGLFSASYWRALAGPYESVTFRRGYERAGEGVSG